jgi:glycosyltransferase involved in cell wall biosynthesis
MIAATPLVSVIVPVLDGEAHIGQCLKSIQEQDYAAVETIVVDGGTDRTDEIVRSIGVTQYVRRPDGGPWDAYNDGVAMAQGRYISFLDADDMMPVSKLSLQVGYLQTHPECSCVLGRQAVLEEGATFRTEDAWSSIAEDDAERDQIPPTSLVVERSVFERIGPFAPGPGFDVDWILRVDEAGLGLHILDEVVLIRRWHGANLTADPDWSARSLISVVKRRLDRRRSEA